MRHRRAASARSAGSVLDGPSYLPSVIRGHRTRQTTAPDPLMGQEPRREVDWRGEAQLAASRGIGSPPADRSCLLGRGRVRHGRAAHAERARRRRRYRHADHPSDCVSGTGAASRAAQRVGGQPRRRVVDRRDRGARSSPREPQGAVTGASSLRGPRSRATPRYDEERRGRSGRCPAPARRELQRFREHRERRGRNAGARGVDQAYAAIVADHPQYALDDVFYYLGLAYELNGEGARARLLYYPESSSDGRARR